MPNLIFLLACLLSFACNSNSYATSNRQQGLSQGANAQKYLVNALPNVMFNMSMNWAGQISIAGTADDELFFWLFEAEKPSNDLISRLCIRDNSATADILSVAQWRSGLLLTRRLDEGEWANLLSRQLYDSSSESVFLDQASECPLH